MAAFSLEPLDISGINDARRLSLDMRLSNTAAMKVSASCSGKSRCYRGPDSGQDGGAR
jgi:hypothetical protein